MCAIIHGQIQARLKNNKKLKEDPDYASLNRIVNDFLELLCTFMGQDYKKVKPNKTDLKANPKLLKPGMSINRQIIINRCIERYRRLAIKDKVKFLKWYKMNQKPPRS